jgi:3-phenylpropionate/trans-cinnamate dioxygenase ferredoxin reductase subunit
LSKEWLRGESCDPGVDVDLAALDVRFLAGCTALRLRPGDVDTDAGSLPYDALVVATGARPVRLEALPDALEVRTQEDSRRLRDLLVQKLRLLVVGAGWLGAEIASSAAAAGCEVTVVEAASAPLQQALGREVGMRTAPWYEQAAVRLLCEQTVVRLDSGRAEFADGRSIPVDATVVAVGVRPDVGWLADSGLVVDGVVPVDAGMRTTAPTVWAVGDVCRWPSRRFGRPLVVQHWDHALRSPAVAAATMLGGDDEYDEVPYFWSEQFGRMLQFTGDRGNADRLVWRGEPGDPAGWTVCWLSGERLDAVLAVDRPRDLVQGRHLIAAACPVDPVRLADLAVPVRAAPR